MNDIDQISRILGRLESDVGYIRKATDEGNGKIDALTKESILHNASLKAAHKRIDIIEPNVTDFVNLKNKAVGAVCSISGLSAVIGAGLMKCGEYIARHI